MSTPDYKPLGDLLRDYRDYLQKDQTVTICSENGTPKLNQAEVYLSTVDIAVRPWFSSFPHFEHGCSVR
jgi:hypothetical protein